MAKNKPKSRLLQKRSLKAETLVLLTRVILKVCVGVLGTSKLLANSQ